MMAVKTPMPAVTPDALEEYLVGVETQREADKAADGAAVSLSRGFDKMATRIDELTDALETAGADTESVPMVVEVLRGWAETLNPAGNIVWDKEDISAKLDQFRAFRTVGMLTDDQLATLERLETSLKFSSGGVRGERTRAPRDPNKPAKVQINGPEGKIGVRAGNVPNAASNLKAGAVDWINTQLPEGEVISTEDAKALLAAAKEVTDNGLLTAGYGGLTFEVVEGPTGEVEEDNEDDSEGDTEE